MSLLVKENDAGCYFDDRDNMHSMSVRQSVSRLQQQRVIYCTLRSCTATGPLC